jgi:glycosyltransferase involved in cell wall biosynthesis
MSKIKVLAYGDYCCATGFATVMGNIMRELNDTGKYEIDVVAINYDGGPFDQNQWPGRVWPAISALRQQGPYADLHGRQVFLDRLSQGDYDVVFIVQDTFIMLPITSQILEIQRNKPKSFSTIYYYPFDCSPKEEWVKQCVASFDFPVAYTEYAKDESRKFIGTLADRHDVIYHGTNTTNFFPIPEEEIRQVRAAFFGENKDRFIIMNLNRNQGRKDVSRSFMILKELRDRGYQEPFLYMHMQETDFGGSIIEQSKNFGLELNKDWTLPNPQQFSAHSGFPIEAVNQLYNASDVYLSTHLGEGWGLSITEAMATKTPIVVPNNTSTPEITNNGERGWLASSGGTPSHWIIKDNDNDRVRPLMNVEEAADRIIEIMENKEGIVEKKTELAYEFAKDLTWKKVMVDWVNVFNKAVNKSKSANLLKGGTVQWKN